jgi:hypothetical protein
MSARMTDTLDLKAVEARVRKEQADFKEMDWGPNDDHDDILALLAALRATRAALVDVLDGLHPITCARSADYWPDEDTSKQCTCSHGRAAAVLASVSDAEERET